MSTIESLSELAIWDEYREFMKERFKQLTATDSPFLVSKTKVDFKVGGSTWKGFAVMVGVKGASTAKLLKKDGIQFREGKCRVDGTELIVGGEIDTYAVRDASETIKKLKLGFTIAGVGDGKPEVQELPAKQEEEVVKKIEERRKEFLAGIAEVEKLNVPANKALVDQAKKALDAVTAACGKKQFDLADKLFDSVEGLLSQAVEGPEPAKDADPDLPGIGDWAAYRTFMKAQIRRLPKEGGPAFISREKVTFTVDGKPFQSHLIVVGQKGRVLVTIMRRAGTMFMEGTARADGTTLRVTGIKMSLLKGAARTMIKLRAGYKIAPEGALPPEEDESAEDTTLDPLGKRSLDKDIKEVAELLVKLEKAVQSQKQSVEALNKEAEKKRKAAEALAKQKGASAEARGQANEAADAAEAAAKRAGIDAGRAAAEVHEFTETLRRIRASADPDKDKEAALKKLKGAVAGRLLDMAIFNIDANDPKSGKVIADQIEKRFGVKLKLYQSTITTDKDGNQDIKDNAKKVDPKKEAATLKELYITLSRAPVFPSSHLKNLKISLRPGNAESEGGVYIEDDKAAEITCRRPSESFKYDLNNPRDFPDGVNKDCQAANADPVNYFDWATLHEVAHAVDAKHQFMNKKGGDAKYGAWIDYGTDVDPIATVLMNTFGKSLAAGDKTKLKAYAMALMQDKKPAAPATAEQRAVKEWVEAVRVGKGLWWNGTESKNRAIGGRVYQESYEGGFWNSYDVEARKQGIHGYQFRARGEWFAELYAAYYSDKLKPSHPFVPDLAKLEQPGK